VSLGELVVSSEFLGVGKVLGFNNKKYEISFFHSPMDPHTDKIQIAGDLLKNINYIRNKLFIFVIKILIYGVVHAILDSMVKLDI